MNVPSKNDSIHFDITYISVGHRYLVVSWIRLGGVAWENKFENYACLFIGPV